MEVRQTFFIGWGTLSLIKAGLAQGKRRSGLIWCLLCLFIRPLEPLLIVVLDPPTPKTESEKP